MSALLPPAPLQAQLRWTGSLMTVLIVHALAIVAGLWWSQRTPPRPDPGAMQAVMVELAPEPVAPPAPPAEVPPGPPQQQQKATPAPKPPPPPDAVAETFEPPPPENSEPAAEQDVAQTLAPPATATTTAAAPAAVQTVAGHSSNRQASWKDTLLGHLQRHRRYPAQAQWQRKEGVAYVQFSVDRQGNVSAIRLGRSSGTVTLDEEALATVLRASPVPAPPDDIQTVPFNVMVPVEFFLRRSR